MEKLFSGAHPHYHLDEGTIQRSKTDDKKLYLNQASDLENSYIGDDRDIVVDIGQISDPSYYLDLLFSLNTTPGNSNGQR